MAEHESDDDEASSVVTQTSVASSEKSSSVGHDHAQIHPTQTSDAPIPMCSKRSFYWSIVLMTVFLVVGIIMGVSICFYLRLMSILVFLSLILQGQ